ncbi:DsbA family protein [Microlunatus speluncae]|uniref:DsbA family protein n=1 Tax=Microlunatus speluncae TaxID=2594267 RepID=UPI001266214A|nr:thioredoxin domain-containing protein [Microlunatus speluncae]
MALIGLLAVASLTTGNQDWNAERVDYGVERRTERDVMAMGRVDAPVVLIGYADYQCPPCRAFARETMPRLVEEYVDAGLLRYEWRDLPVFGEESFDLAVAARAAGRQGHFWAYQAAMFDESANSGQLDSERRRLHDYAYTAGLPDLDRFERDLDDATLVDQVYADVDEAESIGVTATPAFVVGQRLVFGAQSFDYFRQVIDSELVHAGAR